MKKRSWLTGLLLMILASIAVIVRIYYVNRLMDAVNISEDIYNAAKVSVESNGLASVLEGGLHMQSLYICSLYVAFLIFGNFTVAGVYLNILYQVLTILLVYLAVKSLTNRYVGFAGSLLLAIVPGYISVLSEVTVLNMQIFTAALGGAIAAAAVRLLYGRYAAKKNSSGSDDFRDPGRPDMRTIHPEPGGTPDVAASPLPDTSMKEILYEDLEDKKIQYIENPLPVPKRREHKEMDYAFEPTGNKEDYDVKDLTGKDYFDIE